MITYNAADIVVLYNADLISHEEAREALLDFGMGKFLRKFDEPILVNKADILKNKLEYCVKESESGKQLTGRLLNTSFQHACASMAPDEFTEWLRINLAEILKTL